jgi:hypothetical protein
MGCQCSKSTDQQSNMNLEKTPVENQTKEEHPKLEIVKSQARLDSADASKLEGSQINSSKIKKGKKKKKSGKLKKYLTKFKKLISMLRSPVPLTIFVNIQANLLKKF